MAKFTLFSILFLSFYVILIQSETIPFQHVFMQTQKLHSTNATTFYWGLPGNLTINFDLSNPLNSKIIISIKENLSNQLNETKVGKLNNYLNLKKQYNYVEMVFNASQISKSDYESDKCGLFFDEEETFDIDIPINTKEEDGENIKLLFNFIFDNEYEDILKEKYFILENICNLQFNKKFLGITQ